MWLSQQRSSIGILYRILGPLHSLSSQAECLVLSSVSSLHPPHCQSHDHGPSPVPHTASRHTPKKSGIKFHIPSSWDLHTESQLPFCCSSLLWTTGVLAFHFLVLSFYICSQLREVSFILPSPPQPEAQVPIWQVFLNPFWFMVLIALRHTFSRMQCQFHLQEHQLSCWSWNKN